MAFKRKTPECDRMTEIYATDRKTEVGFNAKIVADETRQAKKGGGEGLLDFNRTILSSALPEAAGSNRFLPSETSILDLSVQTLQGFNWNHSSVYHYTQRLFLLFESAIYPLVVGVQHLCPDKHFPRASNSARPPDNSSEICSNGSLSQLFHNCPFSQLSGM